VRGLTVDDFSILEDGVKQQVNAFAFVDLPVDSQKARAAAMKVAEPDVTTNVGEGRTYVMVFTDGGPEVRYLARLFVEQAIGPHDQMALFRARGNMSDAQGLTKSRNAMLAAIDRLTRDFEGLPADDNSMRVTFQVLEELCESLGLISGRRKVVLWFDPPSLINVSGDEPGLASKWFAQRDMVRAAIRNNVAFYVVSSRRLSALGTGGLEVQAGQRALAEDTGGDAIINTNKIAEGFQRFVTDNSAYYLLGYEPRPEHSDGKFHELTVRVNRPGVTVRARRGRYASGPDAKEQSKSLVAKGLSAELAAAVRMPSSVSGLGIQLFTAPFKGANGNGSVVLSAEVRGRELALGPGANIEIGYQATTTEGVVTPGAFHVLQLDLTGESRASIAADGVRFVERLELPRGRHQIRFAASQPNGKTGSVVADVEIPNYSSRLVMSGVVIGTSGGESYRTLLADPQLQAILSTDVTANRRFARNAVISAYFEVYTDANQSQGIRTTAVVSTPSGRQVTVLNLSVVGSAPGRTGYLMRFRGTDLAAGDYVLTLRSSLSRETSARQVPFAIISN
jgi:VWFA-related protein